MCLRSHTGSGNVAQVNQSCLTADIWLRAVIKYLPDQKVNITNYDTGESGARWRKVVRVVQVAWIYC